MVAVGGTLSAFEQGKDADLARDHGLPIGILDTQVVRPRDRETMGNDLRFQIIKSGAPPTQTACI